VTDRDLCFTPASELLRLYKTRRASPLEVMQAVFARIDAVNPVLNAYVTLAREAALAGARKATAALTRKAALPPLHGIPVSIKDLTPTKGIRTTWGSKIFADHVPEEDAITVERLKQAGAIVVGKTNTPEFGAGGNTFNAVFGPTRNPWNPALTCGGSSGGPMPVASATAAPPAAPPWRSPRAWGRSPRARTRAARFACPPRSAAWSASARVPASCPIIRGRSPGTRSA
jgi:Asp-tRNA(Asn)/Glu-tRNA(Gln) amidotransferase A subunit family amidase